MLHVRRLAFALGLGALAACGSSSHDGSEQADGSSAGMNPASGDDASTTASSDDAGTNGSSSTTDSGSTAADATPYGHDAGDASAASDAATHGDAGAVWQPTTAAPIHFHWFIGASDTFASTDLLSGQSGQVVYDIDGANATAADVQAIHAAGAIAVCYVDVGTLEPGRPDESAFTALSPSVIGPDVQGWPGEKWLLVTAANQSAILPLMQARFVNWCQDKGFDAIEPDNLDGWTNISGISEADNLTYDLAIAQLAHALPISIGLKNLMTDLTSSQYPEFLAAFDWALNEQCYEYSECGAYTAAGSFLPAGKAVFDVEYNVAPTCTGPSPGADTAHMNAQETDLDLVGPHDTGYAYTPCIPDSQDTW
jgi:hypothetical protein